MPTAPRRPCLWPRCPALLEHTRKYCQTHAALIERLRGSSAERGYDAEWEAIRARVMGEEPFCRLCWAVGKRTPTAHIDHILPLRSGGTHARENLRGLCERCHNRRTAIESSRWGDE